MEELARTACDSIERDDFAAAAILSRAVMENAALTWMLLSFLENREHRTPQQLNDKLMRVLSGSTLFDEMPKPIHVNDCLRKMDETIPGILKSYDQLSDIAHPNWAGAIGLYSKSDEPNFITHFGRSLRRADDNRDMIVNALLGSLGAFEYAYNRISAVMPAFIAELKPIWSKEDQ